MDPTIFGDLEVSLLHCLSDFRDFRVQGAKIFFRDQVWGFRFRIGMSCGSRHWYVAVLNEDTQPHKLT